MTSDPSRAEAVVAIRDFNRFYTRKIGVLDEGLLESEFSLTEVRVMFELANRPGLIASQLEQDLDLDRGYLSRMLARFAAAGLLQKTRSKADARQIALRLTSKGRRLFADLDARSTRQVRGFVGHLGPGDQARLVGNLRTVRHLLSGGDAAKRQLRLRDPQPGDLGWVVQRHGALYHEEYGWNLEFEALVAQIVADYIQHRDARRDRCWIAELDGEPVGCVFLVRKNASTAKLRLLLVERTARGHGVGRRLVQECIAFARDAGYRRIELWTNNVLSAARHLYEQAGFRLVRAEPHFSFGKQLVGEIWELNLAEQERAATTVSDHASPKSTPARR